MARESGEEKVRDMVSSTGFVYSDISSNNPTIQTHLVNQIHSSFESNPEIFNLTTGMEMNQMIGYQTAKHQSIHDQSSSANMWKGLFFGGKNGNQNHHHPGGPSSSKSDFYDHFTGGIPNQTPSENLMVQASASWASEPDDSSLMRCVFPCEGNERPSQGLSLSLSSTNPSTIGLQSFELRHTPPPPQHHQDDDDDDDHGFYGKSVNNIQSQHQQQMMQDGYLDKAANFHHGGHFQLRNSKYLGPAQQLLNEFCCLGAKQTLSDLPQKQKSHKTNQWDQEEAGSSSRKQPLYSLELMELQKRKAKLLSMLEEVDRRYKHYCDQMKAVVSAFEAVAGNGAARVYSVLASKAMSRHFRCLRDGIVGQIQATKKAMGEKDPVGIPGSTRGETPRLKLLDQTLRQQRAFQQMSMMESHPWRPQRGLPERSVSVLRAWLFEHFLHPYPSDVDKHILARQTGLSRSQVSNWFINARVRLWKPMVEEMYLEETKEQDNMQASSEDSPGLADIDHTRMNQNLQAGPEDEKPTTAQLVRIDSECLSSIITNPDKNDGKDTENLQNDHFHQQQRSFGRVGDAYGAMELDFSSYNYTNDPTAHQHFGGGGGGGGGGVSLTLGLQQHGGSGGVSLGFSPASQNSSIFYTRDHLEDCQVPIQYSILDGEGQNPPYRNLLGAQLLHDLAG